MISPITIGLVVGGGALVRSATKSWLPARDAPAPGTGGTMEIEQPAGAVDGLDSLRIALDEIGNEG